MTLIEVRDMAYEFFIRYGLEGWKFGFNKRNRQLGVCYYQRKLIQVSIWFVRLDDLSQLIDTIKHEIAHALVGSGHRHDWVWKAKARELGCIPKACSKYVAETGTGAKFIAQCACGIPHYRYRKSQKMDGFYCVKLGSRSTPLVFKPV